MQIKLSAKERQLKFFYLLLLTVGSIALISFLLFRFQSSNNEISKQLIISKINREKKFLSIERKSIPLIDEAFKNIQQYDPSINAIYLENDIVNQLEEININFEYNLHDIRYRSFNYINLIGSMYLQDKKIMEKKKKNIALFKDQLNKCEVGFKDVQSNLTLKNALKQGKK